MNRGGKRVLVMALTCGAVMLCFACGASRAEEKPNTPAVSTVRPQPPLEHTDCVGAEAPEALVSSSNWRSETFGPLILQTLRQGSRPLSGRELGEVNDALARRFLGRVGEVYAGGVYGIGIGRCCPLRDVSHEDFLCSNVTEERCVVSLGELAAAFEAELVRRGWRDVRTGVCLMLGGSPPHPE